jgi:hypothetical protein
MSSWTGKKGMTYLIGITLWSLNSKIGHVHLGQEANDKMHDGISLYHFVATEEKQWEDLLVWHDPTTETAQW